MTGTGGPGSSLNLLCMSELTLDYADGTLFLEFVPSARPWLSFHIIHPWIQCVFYITSVFFPGIPLIYSYPIKNAVESYSAAVSGNSI